MPRATALREVRPQARAAVMTLPLSRPRRRQLSAFVWGLVLGAMLMGLAVVR